MTATRFAQRAIPAALVAALLAACGGQGATSSAGSPGAGMNADLLGAGATFPDPLYQEWIGAFVGDNPGVTITYEPIGSGGGVEQFTAKSTDFGGSDAFMTDDELAAAQDAWGCDVVHIPTVFGAVAVAYNLSGVESLTLDSETLAAIFLGEVTQWNDPAIADLNEGVSLPDEPVIVAHRSDGSGTTSIFTTYLDDESADWHDQVGKGKEVGWPVGVGGQGNDGVAAAIAQNDGGIGYVELSYAIQNDLSVASMVNADGKAIEPSLESTAAAADGIEIPDDLRFSILDVGGDGYPIAGATWILAPTCGMDATKADALKAFLTWALQGGDGTAEELLYAPIGEALQDKALANVERINEGGQ
ncbi:MAG TPA: phosphate ABC transporter substrate-binding protein PstS [Candidatus Limnocylindria bacterium]